MTGLFDPARHEPLSDDGWEPDRARSAIAAIVGDVEQAMAADGTWPAHPLDEPGGAPPQRSLYLGAAGVLCALAYLEREGAVRLRTRPATLVARLHAAYRDAPDTGEVVPSHFLGEAGILLVDWRLTREPEAADRLYEAILRNVGNPTNEALWAAPGTMVGAWHMLQWTGEARWRTLFLENVEQLWRTWRRSEHAPCHLWTQDLYGHVGQLIGAGHGFAGNAYPLLRGASLLSDARRETLYARVAETLAATARVDGELANWPPDVGPPRPGRSKILVQWCHGAPGMITGLADVPPGRFPGLDALLVMGGETVWRAGPLEKGPGLCHGTAGNGYALLKLWRRTGDVRWLERARRFAMHAIGQGERMRSRFGQRRYTLWTGDPGLAVFLWQCLVGGDALLGLDTL